MSYKELGLRLKGLIKAFGRTLSRKGTQIPPDAQVRVKGLGLALNEAHLPVLSKEDQELILKELERARMQDASTLDKEFVEQLRSNGRGFEAAALIAKRHTWLKEQRRADRLARRREEARLARRARVVDK